MQKNIQTQYTIKQEGKQHGKSEFTLRSSAESHWIKGEKIRDKKESKKLKKGVDTNSELW